MEDVGVGGRQIGSANWCQLADLRQVTMDTCTRVFISDGGERRDGGEGLE